MIIGDPYKFAIIIEFVPDWNTQNSWRNMGLFYFPSMAIYCVMKYERQH